jgi:hypothetical protein
MKKYGMKCNLSNNLIILDLSADLLKKDLPKIKNAKKKKRNKRTFFENIFKNLLKRLLLKIQIFLMHPQELMY